MAYTLPDLPYSFDALEPHIDAWWNVVDWDAVAERFAAVS